MCTRQMSVGQRLAFVLQATTAMSALYVSCWPLQAIGKWTFMPMMEVGLTLAFGGLGRTTTTKLFVNSLR